MVLSSPGAGYGKQGAAPAAAEAWSCKSYTKDELIDFAGQLYYEQGAHADSSVGCYATGVIWGFALLIAALALARRSRNKEGFRLLSLPVQKTRILLVWGYIFLALSVFAGAWFHAFDTNDPDHKHNFIWFVSIILLGCHASTCSTAVIAMHQIGDITRFRSLFYLAAIVSGPLFVYIVLQWDLPFAAAFSMGAAGPCVLVVWGIGLHGFKYNVWKDAFYSVLGCVMLLSALFIQVGYSPSCAQPCPEGCPFPVPNLNHNAVFHIAAIAALGPMVIGFLGICYELESPDGMPYFNLFARAYPRSVQKWSQGNLQKNETHALLQESERHNLTKQPSFAQGVSDALTIPTIPEHERVAYDGQPLYQHIEPERTGLLRQSNEVPHNPSPSWPGRS